MIVVAGWLRVAAAERAGYLDGCDAVVRDARAAPGCLDFALSADLVDDERINVFEQWESADDVERFRGSGPSGEQQSMILGAHVEQHEVTGSVDLTG